MARDDEIEFEEINLEELELEPLPDEPPPREPRNLRPWIANLVALALIAAVVVMLNRIDRRAPSMVFPDRTHQVLVLENNGNATVVGGETAGPIALLDLDHRIVVRRLLIGNAPNEEVSLLPSGRSIAYGWDRVYDVPFDGGPQRSLGRTSVVIPGEVRGRVLRLEYPSVPERGAPVVFDVGHPGRGRGMDETELGPWPLKGFPGGGIAYGSPHGIILWDSVHERVIRRLGGSTDAWITSGHGDVLSWCENPCRTLHIVRVHGRDHEVRAPNGLRFSRGFPAITRFSPDGRFAAVAAGRYRGDTWTGTDIALIDARTYRERIVYHDPSKLPKGCVLKEISFAGCAPPYVAGPAWSTDGSRLFFLIFDQAAGDVSVGEYNVAAGRVTGIAKVPLSGSYAPIAYDSRDIAGMLRVRLSSQCETSDIRPEYRICAEKF